MIGGNGGMQPMAQGGQGGLGMGLEKPQGAGMAGDAAGLDGAPQQASPEEQAQYEQFVNKAYELIYAQGEANPAILKSLEGNGDPIDGLANTAAMVVLRVEEAAEASGAQLADGVVYNAGIEILEDLASLARTAGIHEFDEKDTEAALYRALDVYRAFKEGAGGIDQQKYQAELGQVVEADRQGKLGQIVPGLDRGKPAPAGGEPPMQKDRPQ